MNPLLKRSLSGAAFLAVTVGLLLCRLGYWLLFAFILMLSFREYYALRIFNRDGRASRDGATGTSGGDAASQGAPTDNGARQCAPAGGCASPGVSGKCTATKCAAFCTAMTALIVFTSLFLHCAFGISLLWCTLAALPLLVADILLLTEREPSFTGIPDLVLPLIYLLVPVAATLPVVFRCGEPYSPMLLLSLFILIWMSDVGAYVIGMGFGQRPSSKKLLPAVSPKKSWIGAAGGVAASLLAAVLLWKVEFCPGIPFAAWAVLGFTVPVAGLLGDLTESLVKRTAGVKDSGSFMPGHGGILDRFDAFFFVLPASAIVLKLFALI